MRVMRDDINRLRDEARLQKGARRADEDTRPGVSSERSGAEGEAWPADAEGSKAFGETADRDNARPESEANEDRDPLKCERVQTSGAPCPDVRKGGERA